MDSYFTMQKALLNTGLYDFFDTTVDSEIRAYSVELDRLDNTVSTLLNEEFFQTASSYGLTNFELLYGPVMDNLSIMTRRKMLLKRESINQNDFTLGGFEKALKSLNLDYVLYEFPKFSRVMIYAQGDYTNAQKNWIRAQLEKIIPAHLEWQIAFNSLSWEELEKKNLSFSEIDDKDLTWEAFDNLSEEDE